MEGVGFQMSLEGWVRFQQIQVRGRSSKSRQKHEKTPRVENSRVCLTNSNISVLG